MPSFFDVKYLNTTYAFLLLAVQMELEDGHFEWTPELVTFAMSNLTPEDMRTIMMFMKAYDDRHRYHNLEKDAEMTIRRLSDNAVGLAHRITGGRRFESGQKYYDSCNMCQGIAYAIFHELLFERDSGDISEEYEQEKPMDVSAKSPNIKTDQLREGWWWVIVKHGNYVASPTLLCIDSAGFLWYGGDNVPALPREKPVTMAKDDWPYYRTKNGDHQELVVTFFAHVPPPLKYTMYDGRDAIISEWLLEHGKSVTPEAVAENREGTYWWADGKVHRRGWYKQKDL